MPEEEGCICNSSPNLNDSSPESSGDEFLCYDTPRGEDIEKNEKTKV